MEHPVTMAFQEFPVSPERRALPVKQAGPE